jgi:microcystin-dependent protein
MPSHSHTVNSTCGGGFSNTSLTGGSPGGTNPPTSSTGGGQSHDHTLSANFVGSSTSTLSPYLVLIYIIKT